MFFNKKYAKFPFSGFTLIELMIVVGILAFLVSIVLFDYKSFNDKLSLSSATQEMAMVIRQAQSYGLNVRETSGGSGQFNSSYGVRFNPTTNPGEYYLFVDTNRDNFYNVGNGCGSSNTECITNVSLKNGVRITGISSTATCQAVNNANYAQVMFSRPNPDAIIRFYNSGGNNLVCVGQSPDIIINLVSSGGLTASVVVESTGQVYVQ